MKVESYKSKDGWRWRAKADNGRIVADSGEAYTRKADLRRALADLAAAVLKVLTVVCLCAGMVGCASMTAYDPGTGHKVYESKRLLQKGELKSAKVGEWEVHGWRNDGGLGALETVTGMAIQQMGLNAQLQAATLNAQIAALKAQLEAATSTTTTPVTPATTTTASVPVTDATSTTAPDNGDDVEFE